MKKEFELPVVHFKDEDENCALFLEFTGNKKPCGADSCALTAFAIDMAIAKSHETFPEITEQKRLNSTQKSRKKCKDVFLGKAEQEIGQAKYDRMMSMANLKMVGNKLDLGKYTEMNSKITAGIIESPSDEKYAKKVNPKPFTTESHD